MPVTTLNCDKLSELAKNLINADSIEDKTLACRKIIFYVVDSSREDKFS
jgi:hypothetical protein